MSFDAATESEQERLERYLELPYVFVAWSHRSESGVWVRHAAFPDLPGCSADAPTMVEAEELAEQARRRFLAECARTGTEPPKPSWTVVVS